MRPFPRALFCLLASVPACNCHTSGTLGNSSGQPKIQAGGGVTTPDPAHAAVDFGVVPVGQQKTIDVSLANAGIATLNITHVVPSQPDPEFTLDLAEGTQIGSSAISVPAHFTPFGSGTKTAIFTLSTDSSAVPTITLTLTGQGVKLDVQVVPEALDFGRVVIHTSWPKSITLTNASAAAVTVTLSAVQGSDASLFTLGTLPQATMAPGQTETLTVVYAPIVVSSAPSTAFFSISECAGCAALPISLRGQPVDTGLSVTPNPLDFGFVPLSSAGVVKSITLANVANRDIHFATLPLLDTGHPAAAFSPSGWPAFPLTLHAGQSQAIAVAFAPTALEEFTGSITFYSDDPQATQVTVPLDGTGGGPTISCLPASLSFGQVALGAPVTQQLLCTNVGQDVPGNPASALQLTALTVKGDAAFSARFDATPPASGLASGQSLVIDVTYAPSLAQADQGTLHIASNDGVTPDTAVPLAGTAVSLPPCDFAVAPQGGLSFGLVEAGKSLQLPFAVRNLGNGDCLVAGLALTAASDPSFSLPQGQVPSQILSYPGNPQGAPSSLTVPVQFAPQAAGNFQGAVAFTISDPSAPQQQVTLSGQSGPSCLVITPSAVDFGVVGLDPATNAWCSSLRRNVQLVNTCAYDLHITSIAIGNGTGSAPQFVLSGQPASYPYDLASGSATSFQVAFQPDSAGPEQGTVGVTTEEAPTGPYYVPLQGSAQPNGQETDTFAVQSSQPKVDLLWVIDNDDDLPQDQLVAQNLPAFFASAGTANVDFHMAVTDTDTCNTPGADQGSFEPCSHCYNATSPNALIITSQDADPQGELSGLIQINNYACTSAPQDEQILEAMYQALQPSLLAGHNAGFLRDDAFLAVLAIDGDSEDDLSPQSLQAYYDALVTVKGDPALVSFNYVNQGLSQIQGQGGPLPRVTQLVNLTNGVEADTTTTAWSGILNGLWSSAAAAAYRYPLSGQPVASTVAVTLDGNPYPQVGSHGNPQWSYDATTNAVVFTAAAAPQAGDVVTVTYTVACS
ncbi:MAG: choice-of-anchor D domain-containing protein [Myxococcales bacterium]